MCILYVHIGKSLQLFVWRAVHSGGRCTCTSSLFVCRTEAGTCKSNENQTRRRQVDLRKELGSYMRPVIKRSKQRSTFELRAFDGNKIRKPLVLNI